jgi:dTDP-4-dehydrorhamnose 3,5-epimerase
VTIEHTLASSQRDFPRLESVGLEDTYLIRAFRNDDERGWLAELLRDTWVDPLHFCQINVVRSRAGTLRGVHWHEDHHDLIAPVAGHLMIGLSDLRIGSPTEGAGILLELAEDPIEAVLVPPGVAHGFYSARETTVLYAISRPYDGDDEYGVAFDDERLSIPWPVGRGELILSARDAALPRLGEGRSRPAYPAA